MAEQINRPQAQTSKQRKIRKPVAIRAPSYNVRNYVGRDWTRDKSEVSSIR